MNLYIYYNCNFLLVSLLFIYKKCTSSKKLTYSLPLNFSDIHLICTVS